MSDNGCDTGGLDRRVRQPNPVACRTLHPLFVYAHARVRGRKKQLYRPSEQILSLFKRHARLPTVKSGDGVLKLGESAWLVA